MKKFFTVLSIATLFLIGFSFSIVRAEDAAKYASSDKAEYKEVIPGLSKSVLWGDPDKGAYGAFTKMAPGFDAGMHTHTNNVWIVVHKGAYLYKDSAGEKRVGVTGAPSATLDKGAIVIDGGLLGSSRPGSTRNSSAGSCFRSSWSAGLATWRSRRPRLPPRPEWSATDGAPRPARARRMAPRPQ